MKEDEPLLKVNPQPEAELQFAKTSSLSRKVVFEDVPVSRHAGLEISHPGLKPVSVDLDNENTLIGRGSNCRIQLQVHNTSRLHALIVYRNDEYHIEDLDSTNGTFVNGVAVKKCLLRNNDCIQIGDVKILFVEEEIRRDI